MQTTQMPKVMECDARECSYNQQGMCHALAITIGAADDHKCDTFCTMSMKGGAAEATASVGACKAASCVHNKALECSAPAIKVGYDASMVDCLTFSMN